jgi:hypothetical protein
MYAIHKLHAPFLVQFRGVLVYAPGTLLDIRAAAFEGSNYVRTRNVVGGISVV